MLQVGHHHHPHHHTHNSIKSIKSIVGFKLFPLNLFFSFNEHSIIFQKFPKWDYSILIYIFLIIFFVEHSRCDKKVDASKRFQVHELPMILTVQLKRFSFTGKINKFVPYPEKLDMSPYMSSKKVRFWNYPHTPHTHLINLFHQSINQ